MRHRYAHLSDAALLRELATRIARDRATTADLVALIAEVDARRLFVAAGHSSMHAYCVDELHLSDDEAYKRITAARTARRFPLLFMELAEGRLHMTAVCTLAPRLTEENVAELVHAAKHRRRTEIEDLLALRYPPSTVDRATSATTGQGVLLPELAPERVGGSARPPDVGSEKWEVELLDSRDSRDLPDSPDSRPASERVGPGGTALAPERVDAPQRQVAQRPVERVVQLMIRKSTHEKLRYAQALLSHAVPSGDVSNILERALDLLIAKVERRKFGAGNKTRVRRPDVSGGRPDVSGGPPDVSGGCPDVSGGRPDVSGGRPDVSAEPVPSTPVTSGSEGPNPLRRARTTAYRTRYIPARVRRAVWERDQGRCTFLGPKGTRCAANRFLEFDHVNPYARGGRPTIEGLRLRCSAHNQFEALRVFGAEFISRKRRERRAARKALLSREGNAAGSAKRIDHPDP